MVETGHSESAEPVARYGFSNPDHPRLGLEVVDYAQLISRLSPRVRTIVHRTDFHQMFLISTGEAVAMVDFVDHPCPPGTLLHVPPGCVLRLPRPAEPNTALSALMVLFVPDFPPRLTAASTLLGPFGPTILHLESDERSHLTQAVGDLAGEYARAVRQPENPVTVDVLRHLLAALLLRIVRVADPGHAYPREPGGDVELVRRFQQELERSFADTRGAADYAAKLGYSTRTLNRACLAVTGLTAKALIDARVALEAKRLLAHTDLPIAAIGHRLGFTEPTNFGKFFTRHTGTTPGAFRTDQHL